MYWSVRVMATLLPSSPPSPALKYITLTSAIVCHIHLSLNLLTKLINAANILQIIFRTIKI